MIEETRGRRCYAARVGEIAVALLLAGVLLIADPDRLQRLLDKVRQLSAWLAE